MMKMNEQVPVNKGVLWLIGGITPLTILCVPFYLGFWKKDIEDRIFDTPEQKTTIINQALNPSTHATYKQNAIDFVPRTEVEYKLRDIQEDLKDIKDALRIKSN